MRSPRLDLLFAGNVASLTVILFGDCGVGAGNTRHFLESTGHSTIAGDSLHRSRGGNEADHAIRSLEFTDTLSQTMQDSGAAVPIFEMPDRVTVHPFFLGGAVSIISLSGYRNIIHKKIRLHNKRCFFCFVGEAHPRPFTPL